MCNIDSFKIDLKALPQGITEKEFKLTNEYFEAIDAPDVQRGELSSSLSVNRTDDFFELNFHTEGVVHIPCDICLDDMDQTIETNDRLVVKFGEEYSEDDDLVTVAENEWHTEVELDTGDCGCAAFRGFYGKYDVEVVAGDMQTRAEIHLTKDGTPAFTITL